MTKKRATRKAAVTPSPRRCTCDEPRTTMLKAITRAKADIVGPSAASIWFRIRCERCGLPLAQQVKKGPHVHCWHPRRVIGKPFNMVAHSLGTGADECKCCVCGSVEVRKWQAYPVPNHGPHWRVIVKVYEP